VNITEPPQRLPEFSLARGAPFCRLQERLGLIRPTTLQPGRRAVLFTLIAWLPLAVATFFAGTFSEPHDPRAFAHDYTVHARLLVAIPLFLVLEVIAHTRIDLLVRHFLASGLVPPQQADPFRQGIATTLRRRNSGRCELVILLLAVVASVVTVWINLGWRSPSWIGSRGEGGLDLAAAGWWYLLVSGPMFFFLLFRWMWRYGLWVGLLRQIARLDLRLVATHPDRAGGLMFISQYPEVFQAFAFAVSCVAASSIARDLVFEHATIAELRPVMIAWVVAIVLLFIAPLTIFGKSLRTVKRRALFDYSAFATRHNLAFEQRWVRDHTGESEPLGTPDISSLADLGAGFEAVRSMRTIPLSKEAILPITVASLLPMLLAAATQVPFKELLSLLKFMMI
jgi:hypothetical protein